MAWLIERDLSGADPVRFMRLVPSAGWWPLWTSDKRKALRFRFRHEAERFMTAYRLDRLVDVGGSRMVPMDVGAREHRVGF